MALSCERVVSRFVPIIDALDSIYNDRMEPEVFGLRNALLQKDVIATVYLCCDVLKIVNKFSMFLQVI
jgi:hypothetical protein